MAQGMEPSSFRLCPVRRPGPQLLRHSQRKRGATARLNLRSMALVLDPTGHLDPLVGDQLLLLERRELSLTVAAFS
jgi:hypothetical protein